MRFIMKLHLLCILVVLFSGTETQATTISVGNVLLTTVPVTGGFTTTTGLVSLNSGSLAFFTGGGFIPVFGTVPSNGGTSNVILLVPTTTALGSSPAVSVGGSVFNPFPLEGAAAPLRITGSSVFNPFPFSGATAPLATTTGAGFVALPVTTTTTSGLTISGTVLLTPVSSLTSTSSGAAPFVAVPTTVPPGASAATPPNVVFIQNPEPASLLLFGTGLPTIGWLIRKRLRQQQS